MLLLPQLPYMLVTRNKPSSQNLDVTRPCLESIAKERGKRAIIDKRVIVFNSSDS